nr:glycoside hydrolase family protein [Citrobacter freundii]
MSEVSPFNKDEPVWHFHPVVFLSALSRTKTNQIIFPLKVKPKNDMYGIWGNYFWAAALKDKNASQAIFGRNRNNGGRKHAARDLYTEPLTEIVSVCNGVVKYISEYYYQTWQITIEHTTDDGQHFYVKYGEVDPNSILVNVNDNITQGTVIAKTGLLINPRTGRHPVIIPREVVYMLHFEYYPSDSHIYPPNNMSIEPFQRREDLHDPIDILTEGYHNTFDEEQTDVGERVSIEYLTVSNEGKTFIKEWEGCQLTAYNDSEGFCTIGYGHLIARTKCENITLPEEFEGEITKNKADELFDERVVSYVSELKRTVSVALYQYEFDALISLLFNMGSMSKAPMLNAKLNKRDYFGASNEFLDITNGGVAGLVKRRRQEQNIFLNNDYDSSH